MATLKERIETLFISGEYKGAEQTAKELAKIVGAKCRCYDSGIDDGVDDDESKDRYIIYSSFGFEGSPLVVKVVYGDVTHEIGCVEVRNADEHERESLDKEFKITSVCRADLEDRGFDVSNITDAQMEELAKRMCTDYLEQMFWISLDIIAEDIMGLPKKK